MASLEENHYRAFSSLIKSNPPDLQLISREGSRFQSWTQLVCLQSSSFTDIIAKHGASKDTVSVSVDSSKDDLEKLLETIHYDMDVDCYEVAAILGIGKRLAKDIPSRTDDSSEKYREREETLKIESDTKDEINLISLPETDPEIDTIKKLSCPVCGLYLSRKQHLVRHVKIHSIDMFHCDLCSKKFRCEKVFQNHRETHKEKLCKFCNLSFRRPFLLLKHIKEKHENERKKNKRKIECNICVKTFHRPNKLIRHMNIIHSQKIDSSFQVKCDRCDAIFNSSKELNLHLFQTHIDCALGCEDCDRVFFTQIGLKRHGRKEHE